MALRIENRLTPRMPLTLPARMVTATDAIKCEIENISRHGAFIRCQETLKPGERLIVVAKFPLHPFNCHAEVVWLRVPRPNEEQISRGIGVKFIDSTQISLILEPQPIEGDEQGQATTF